MRKKFVMSACIVAALPFMPAFGDSALSVFFDFSDGESGTEVATVQDTSGAYTGTAAATNANGQKPTFSDDSPGRISTLEGDTVATSPKSLNFSYKDTSSHQSGYVDVASLADAISGLDAFTVEYFVKMDPSFVYYSASSEWAYTSKTALYLQSGSAAFKQITPSTADSSSGHALGLGLQVYKDDSYGVPAGSLGWLVGSSRPDISDGEWHHVAAVYTQTNETSSLGSLAFYCDHTYIGALTYCNAGGSDLKFRIGSGYKDAGGSDKTATESIHASISCLRVTGAALAVEQQMYADSTIDISSMATAAFYDFKDGVSGASVSSVGNKVDSTMFAGSASTLGDGSVVFSDERPSATILGSSSSSDVLVENPQSVRFVGGRSGHGGKVSFDSLATSLSRVDAYTVEFFFKMDAYDNYRTMAAWKFGDSVAVKLNMTGTAGSYSDTLGTYNACSLESLTNTTGSTLKSYSETRKMSCSLGDSWHHFAAVYTRSDDSIWFYIDRKQVGSALSVTNQFTLAQYPFVLGTSAFSFKESQECFGGYISCLRVTPTALTTDAFMATSENAVPSNTVFALDFNSGTAGTRILSGSTGYTTAYTYPDSGWRIGATAMRIISLAESCGSRLREIKKWTRPVC